MDLGGGIRFEIKDLADVDNNIGAISMERDGADNSGKMRISTRNAGSSVDALTILKDGKAVFGALTTLGLFEVFASSTTQFIIEASGQAGFGIALPEARIHSVDATLAAILERSSSLTTSGANVTTIRHTTSGDMADGFGGGINFQIKDSADVDNNIGTLLFRRSGADNTSRFELFVRNSGSSVLAYTVSNDGGLFMTGATGSSQGVGTINATGVFDDGVLLTDHVFEHEYEQLQMSEMEEFYKTEKHLPTIKGAQDWNKKRFSLGEICTMLWETVEVQAKYISQLNNRILKLETI